MRLRFLTVALLLTACMGAPSERSSEAAPVDDPAPDELYGDFLDGKYDGAGHPIGASIFEGEAGCDAETGTADKSGALVLRPDVHVPGIACTGVTRRLGRGLHTLNVRAAIEDAPVGAVLEARVLDAAGGLLAESVFDGARFEAPSAFQNLALAFTVRDAGEVRVEVRWTGETATRLDYVEVFRRDRQLVLSPTSGVLPASASFRIELVDPADDTLPRVTCNGEDVTAALERLVAGGEATDERTDFRRILTTPAGALFEGCGPDRTVVVEAGEGWRTTTSEVRYLAAPIACAFAEDRPRVLLTGFVPFPAGARSTNSSSLAVTSFDPSEVPDASVMVVVLPVEFESAAAIVSDVIARCRPDVVVGFGQGRHRVDLETTGYNRRDTSEVAGGVPDNRGVILDGSPIFPSAPATLSSRLPLDEIEAALLEAGVDAGLSDDPGLYVCNDLLFSILTATSPEVPAGFVHLPRIFSPTEDDVQMLRTVVEEVVRRSIARPRGA